MRIRIWPFVGICFLVLLLLVPLFAYVVSREAAQIDARAREAHRAYQAADDAVTEVRADIYKAALVMRDALNTGDRTVLDRQLGTLRTGAAAHLQTLEALLDTTQHAQLVDLRRALDRYWASASSGGHTEQVLQLAERVDALNEANLSIEEQQIQLQQQSLRRLATGAMGLLLAAGHSDFGGKHCLLGEARSSF